MSSVPEQTSSKRYSDKRQRQPCSLCVWPRRHDTVMHTLTQSHTIMTTFTHKTVTYLQTLQHTHARAHTHTHILSECVYTYMYVYSCSKVREGERERERDRERGGEQGGGGEREREREREREGLN